jgi:hypothetical protein
MNLLTLLTKAVMLPFKLAWKLAVFVWADDDYEPAEIEEPTYTYVEGDYASYDNYGNVVGMTDGFHDS